MGRRLSYFDEGDLELTAADLGHLDEEGRLVGVVFDDVVVHVDENPEEKTIKKCKVNLSDREDNDRLICAIKCRLKP